MRSHGLTPKGKLCQLVVSQHEIYGDHSVGFHRDFDTVIERKPNFSKRKIDEEAEIDLDIQSDIENTLYSRCSYDPDNFIVLLEDGGEGSDSFWVANIVDSQKSTDGSVTSIVVH